MNILVLCAALAAVAIFGASPVAGKIATNEIPAMDVALLRTIIGGLIALPLSMILKIHFPQSFSQRWLLIVSGFCGFLGFPVFFTLGIQLTSANHASMILAALPVMTGAIAMTWDREKPKWLWGMGCLTALIGEAFLIFGSEVIVKTGSTPSSIEGDLLVLVSNLFAALGYVAGGRLQRTGYSAKGTTFWGVGIFALILIPVLPFVWHPIDLQTASTGAWLGIVYLAIGVTIVGYIFWYWALGSGGIARVGLIQFLQPVSGILLAWILLNEVFSAHFFIASAIVLCGVWLALKGK